jgi:hypothetical protein
MRKGLYQGIVVGIPNDRFLAVGSHFSQAPLHRKNAVPYWLPRNSAASGLISAAASLVSAASGLVSGLGFSHADKAIRLMGL